MTAMYASTVLLPDEVPSDSSSNISSAVGARAVRDRWLSRKFAKVGKAAPLLSQGGFKVSASNIT
jgi:hypothetical protein